MKLLVIADDELMDVKLPDITADVLVSCGDLPDSLILKVAAHARCQIILAVKGNHDLPMPFPAPIIDLHLGTHVIDSIIFGGFNGCWKYKPRGNFLYENDEVSQKLSSFPPVDVFVAHNSPSGMHERDGDTHRGFDAFNEYIARAHPRIFFHGHQHIDAETMAGTTKVLGVNRYRYVELG